MNEQLICLRFFLSLYYYRVPSSDVGCRCICDTMNEEEDNLLGENMKDSYKELLDKVQSEKVNAIGRFNKEIQKQLEDEILKRYFYRNGLYQHYLKNDDAILTSVSILEDPNRYNGILQ